MERRADAGARVGLERRSARGRRAASTGGPLLCVRYAEALLERAPNARLHAAIAGLRLEAAAKTSHAVTLDQIEETGRLIEQAGFPPLALAGHIGNLAIVAGRSGHADVARRMHERTHQIFLDAYGPDHPDTQAEAQNLAADAILLEKYDEALPCRSRATSSSVASERCDRAKATSPSPSSR